MFLIIIKLYKPRTTPSRFESHPRRFGCDSIRTIKNKLTEFVCKTKSRMNLALQKSQIQNNISSRNIEELER